jgi:hypothetical protein
VKYRLLAIDVDGTLVNTSGEIPEANLKALHEAHESGLTLCLCTGRSLTEAKSVIQKIGLDLDVGVFVFGAIVADLRTFGTLYASPFTPELADRVIHHFQARGHPVWLLFDPHTSGLEYQLIAGTRGREASELWAERTPSRVERREAWEPGPHAPIRIGVIESPESIAEVVADLHAAFAPGDIKFNAIHAPNYGIDVVECFMPMVNKWSGIMKVADRLEIRREEIVTIGDDINDLEMIREAGLGVAMGNAIEPIKRAAREQVADNNAAGVAELVRKLLSGIV